jgi:hypothetical protein
MAREKDRLRKKLVAMEDGLMIGGPASETRERLLVTVLSPARPSPPRVLSFGFHGRVEHVECGLDHFLLPLAEIETPGE